MANCVFAHLREKAVEGGRFPNSLILSWDRPGGRPWGMKLGPMHGRLFTDLILILPKDQDVGS